MTNLDTKRKQGRLPTDEVFSLNSEDAPTPHLRNLRQGATVTKNAFSIRLTGKKSHES